MAINPGSVGVIAAVAIWIPCFSLKVLRPSVTVSTASIGILTTYRVERVNETRAIYILQMKAEEAHANLKTRSANMDG